MRAQCLPSKGTRGKKKPQHRGAQVAGQAQGLEARHVNVIVMERYTRFSYCAYIAHDSGSSRWRNIHIQGTRPNNWPIYAKIYNRVVYRFASCVVSQSLCNLCTCLTRSSCYLEMSREHTSLRVSLAGIVACKGATRSQFIVHHHLRKFWALQC